METKKVFYKGSRVTRHKLAVLRPGENEFSVDVANKLISLKLVEEVKQVKKYEDKSISKNVENKSFSRKGKAKHKYD